MVENKEDTLPEKKGLAIHWQIGIGMLLGLLVGLILNFAQLKADSFGSLSTFVVNLNQFVGDVFIRGLRFVAVPIVLFSLIVGAGGLDDIRKLGRMGIKTFLIYMFTTGVAISFGLLLANMIQPWSFVPAELRDQLALEGMSVGSKKLEVAKAPDVWMTILNIIPTNPFRALAEGKMLQVVFFALAVGLGLNLLPKEKSQPILTFCEGMTDIMIKLVLVLMRLAPFAVFALIAKVIASLGVKVLGALLAYVLTVMLGLGLMIFVLYPAVLLLLTKINLRTFFSSISPALLLAFSSSSSSATMPVTMECVEKRLGVQEDVTSFVIPLGATINMDGTALYQGVATLFIAFLYGHELGFAEQLTVVLTATLASIGTAGVPGVGLIMLVIVMQSVGLPTEVMASGIGIIFGVDRLLDMCRTTCNVTGDCMVAAVVNQLESNE